MVRWFDDVYSEEGPFWSTFEHRTFATPWKNLPSQGSFEMPWLQPKRCGDVSTSGPIVTSRCFPQTYCMICMYFCTYVFFTNSIIVIYIYMCKSMYDCRCERDKSISLIPVSFLRWERHEKRPSVGSGVCVFILFFRIFFVISFICFSWMLLSRWPLQGWPEEPELWCSFDFATWRNELIDCQERWSLHICPENQVINGYYNILYIHIIYTYYIHIIYILYTYYIHIIYILYAVYIFMCVCICLHMLHICVYIYMYVCIYDESNRKESDHKRYVDLQWLLQ